MDYETINIDGHLRLIQLRPDQAARLFELTDSNREYLGKFLAWVPLVKEVADSRRRIEKTIESRARGTSYVYGIEVDGKVVGDIGLRHLKDDTRPPEIGYWIAPEYSGRGITTRAVRALTDFGLRTLGVKKVVIRANIDNIASNRVAKKAGYSLVGQEQEDGKTLNIWSIEDQ